MLRIEALIEDRSGAYIVEALLRDVIRQSNCACELFMRPHRGVGHLPADWNQTPLAQRNSLLGLLPAKMRSYEALSGIDLLLVVFDSDTSDPEELQKQVWQLSHHYLQKLPLCLGIAVEELEAWLLGDPKAILQAYPQANRELLRAYRQDSICGTWEHLARVLMGSKAERLIHIGYPAVGAMKFEWAERIAPYLRAERNSSPSCRRFLKQVKAFLQQTKEENA